MLLLSLPCWLCFLLSSSGCLWSGPASALAFVLILHPSAHNVIQTHSLNCSLFAYDSHMYPFPPTPPLFFSWRSGAHFFLLPSHPGFNTTRLNYGSVAWSLFCPKSPSSLTDPFFLPFRSKSWDLSCCLSHVPPLVHPVVWPAPSPASSQSHLPFYYFNLLTCSCSPSLFRSHATMYT